MTKGSVAAVMTAGDEHRASADPVMSAVLWSAQRGGTTFEGLGRLQKCVLTGQEAPRVTKHSSSKTALSNAAGSVKMSWHLFLKSGLTASR
jgi:hypothetical protein